MINDITLADIEYVAFKLAQEKLLYDEPIPDFNTRFPNILESCLANPFQSYAGKSLYPNLISKAAILFYLLIKNHPFKNGNKRIAMTSLFLFLYNNNKWLEVNNMQLYNFTIWIAESLSMFKKETIMAIGTFLGKYIVDLKTR